MAEIVTTTATGTTWRKHRCEHCRGKYAYPMTRTGTGECGTGPFGMAAKQALNEAKRLAREDLEDRLAMEVDAVPCPHCGTFQKAMLAKMRREIRAWRPNALLIAGGALALLVALFGTLIWKNDPNPKPVITAMMLGGWLAVLACLAIEFVRVVLRGSEAAKFDPYQGEDEEYWKRRARKLGAVTPEELDRILDAEEAEREALEALPPVVSTEVDPFSGQVDLTAKANPFADEVEPPPAPWGKGARPGRRLAAQPPPPPTRTRPSTPAAAPPSDKNPFDFG